MRAGSYRSGTYRSRAQDLSAGVTERRNNMGKKKKLRASMAANIIGSVVLLLVLYGVIVSVLGYMNFTRSFKTEYSETTYHIAKTAATLVNGDHLSDYLHGRETEEYQSTQNYLDGYCKSMSVSLIYVIQVDQNDYGRFISIFNLVDNTVDDTEYVAWEIGHRRDTTNNEYRQKYRAMYEQTAPYETVYRIKTTDGQHPHITTMVPVLNRSGDTVAILCVQRPVRELYQARIPYVKSIAFSTILLVIIASAFIASYIRRNFVDPVRKVSEEAVRFARENTKGEDLSGISSYEEIARLAGSIDTMETDMVSYIENLTAATAEKERIGAEMSLARTIQVNSIPNVFPAFPDRKEFDVFASMDPAKEVGGDFYNFFLIDDDHLALMIGDVSGKGVPAALFMMVTNIIIIDRTRMGGTPAEILAYVNNSLSKYNKAEMFVTVWMGILELSTGKLTAANAGHEYPVLKKPDGEFTLLKSRHGLAAGAMENTKYRDYTLPLEPGSKLFVYTDGVPEATAADVSMFGTDRMLTALNKDPEADPEQILKNVRAAVDGFVEDAEQFDDLTMLCIEYRGNGAASAAKE